MSTFEQSSPAVLGEAIDAARGAPAQLAHASAFGLTWEMSSTPYDLDFVPSTGTRETTNYANLARDPATRRQNLAVLFGLINQALNRQLDGNSLSMRFVIELNILSLSARFDCGSSSASSPTAASFPLTEVMQASVYDTLTGDLDKGPTGLNFSSYLRDYDFKINAPKIAAGNASQQEREQFGLLHGVLSQMQFGPRGYCADPLTVAISILQKKQYMATDYVHAVLGREYLEMGGDSPTTQYFRLMALTPRFFRPRGFPAPLAFYAHMHDPLTQKSPSYLAALIAVMGTFQRIYRPEIYMARTGMTETPGQSSQLALANTDFDRLPIDYDKVERDDLAQAQALRMRTEFLTPYAQQLHNILRHHTGQP